MKILYISFYYAPYNSIGALRAVKTVKHLKRLGHDVCVLTANKQRLPETLTDNDIQGPISYTDWIDVNSIVTLLSGGERKVGKHGYPVFNEKLSILNKLGHYYKCVFNFPDAQIGWFPFAVLRGKKILKEAKFDVIYASAWPVTSMLVASRLSKLFGVPWVCEYRDLWTKNPYVIVPNWRKNFEKFLEASILKSSSGLVTISQPHAEQMKSCYDKPICVVRNGFDPEDYKFSNSKEKSPQPIRIVHTGTIYHGKRSPEPLLRSLAKMEKKNKNFRLSFVGRYAETLTPLVARYGLQEIVEVHGQVSRKKSIMEQTKADILLLLLWDNPEEEGNYSGKFFDYLGARKPILLIGPKNNVAAKVIEKFSIGYTSTDFVEIENFLLLQLSKSDSQNYSRAYANADLSMFTRASQVNVLDDFLKKIIESEVKKLGMALF